MSSNSESIFGVIVFSHNTMHTMYKQGLFGRCSKFHCNNK